MKWNFVSYGAICVICILFFIFFPASLLAFSGELFAKGEVWRLFTFTFTHTSFYHLIQNLIALTIVTILLFELEVESHFRPFISSSWIVAGIAAIILPTMLMAGASVGIYGLLGFAAMSSVIFIPRMISVPLFGGAILLDALIGYLRTSAFNIPQLTLHFGGYICGITIFTIVKLLKGKKHVLRR